LRTRFFEAGPYKPKWGKQGFRHDPAIFGREQIVLEYFEVTDIGARNAMHGLTKNLRRRAAILIAVAYAFCVVTPAAALAFGDSPTVFHCLQDKNTMANAGEHGGISHAHGDGAIHQHEQSSVPDHHSNQDGKADAGNCCGLFCVSALAYSVNLTFGAFAPASPSVPAVANGLTGRAPAPLHRPPIA
jgi:hypothetical protein